MTPTALQIHDDDENAKSAKGRSTAAAMAGRIRRMVFGRCCMKAETPEVRRIIRRIAGTWQGVGGLWNMGKVLRKAENLWRTGS
jgi:hypothetical protein